MYKFIVLSLCFILISKPILFAQKYTSPVDLEMFLSGTFGELRNNHFHAGIDIKTNGVQGHKLRSIDDGYVSRIKVSSWGYGKTIYINHPETGHTSVYAHLQRFSNKIDSIVLRKHYQEEKFELDFSLNKNIIKIKKGELIGYSGNSGSSAGPHLHFEIRETKNQKPINPLQFGFKIKDDIPPKLVKLKIYAFDTTLINGYNSNKTYDLFKKGENYHINEIPEISGPFAIGIYTYDQSNGSYNKNGIYNIKLFVDTIKYYEFKVDKLDFNTTRYINAHIDYYEKKANKIKFHRCYKLKNNDLETYPSIVNNGIINLKNNLHTIKIEVKDIYNNKSSLHIKVKVNNTPLLNKCKNEMNKKSILFDIEKPNIFKSKDIELHMKSFSLYEDIYFKYKKNDSLPETFGPIHKIHESTVPIHKKYIISIKSKVPKHLKNKVFIASIDKKGDYNYIGGVWKNGFLRAKIREFGDFCVVADTINPNIKAVNIFPGKEIKKQKTIQFTIKDNLSGIKKFKGEINGKWILLDYDHKRNLLTYNLRNKIHKGKQIIKLDVFDNVNNKTTYISEIIF